MKGLVLSFLLSVFVLNSSHVFSQSEPKYQDYKPYEKTELMVDGCEATNNWLAEDAKTTLDIKDGTFVLGSKVEKEGRRMSKKLKIDQKKDFEIEADLRFISSEPSCFSYMFWGSNFKNKNDYLYFGFTCRGEVAAGKSLDQAGITDFISFKPTSVKPTQYTKLTIRKIKNKYYFWVNENFVGEYNFEKFLGKDIGFYAGDGATIQIDRLSVQYLMEKA